MMSISILLLCPYNIILLYIFLSYKLTERCKHMTIALLYRIKE